jgi:ABC-type branched-subunit amino acid transport system ATPase component
MIPLGSLCFIFLLSCFSTMSLVDVHFFDGIFDDGRVTEGRIDAAGVRIMQIAEKDRNEAEKATRILEDILILAIANALARNPQACASHYLTIARAALGEPTLLDQIKGQEKA